MSVVGVDRAVVVDRWPLMRLGLTRALQGSGVTVVGEAAELGAGVALLTQTRAGLLVVGDASAADVETLAGVTAPGEGADRSGARQVLALVGSGSRDVLVGLRDAGVAGVALRSVGPEELRSLLDQLARGERAVSPALVPTLVGLAAPDGGPPAADGPGGLLTGREREVLHLVAAGASNRAIAAQLYVTGATVKTHLAHIYAKLEVGTRQDAVARGVALGLLG